MERSMIKIHLLILGIFLVSCELNNQNKLQVMENTLNEDTPLYLHRKRAKNYEFYVQRFRLDSCIEVGIKIPHRDTSIQYSAVRVSLVDSNQNLISIGWDSLQMSSASTGPFSEKSNQTLSSFGAIHHGVPTRDSLQHSIVFDLPKASEIQEVQLKFEFYAESYPTYRVAGDRYRIEKERSKTPFAQWNEKLSIPMAKS